MAGAGDKNFVKQLEADADNVKSKLKKTNTDEKNWKPTADDIKAEKAAK